MKVTHRIQFQHLQKSELIYEVTIRGETPENTCAKLRNQMAVLRRTYPPAEVKESTYSFDEDYRGIRKTLKTIQKNISIIEKCYMMRVAAQTLAMINHLYYRVRRWMNGQNKPQNKSAIKKIRKKSKRLMRRFSTISDSRSEGGSSLREVEETITISDTDSISGVSTGVQEINSTTESEGRVREVNETVNSDFELKGGSSVRVVEESSPAS